MANSPLKIVAEQCVPYLGALEKVARVIRLPYGEITRDAVRDANALIVRTRNLCGASLLEGTAVEFIGTATIGTDHIDLPWCASHGIEVANAPGCNAPAVAQYVFSSLMQIINRPLTSYCLGIVGVGHVGGIVERWARALHIRVMRCDPPRRQADPGQGQWYSLEELAAKADIITFHTPLTESGEWPTYHMADRRFFASLRRAPVIINSARGAVVDNVAWAEAIEKGLCGPAVVDCWEGEPDISRRLLDLAAVATPHIAGYSAEGKWRATQMVLDALCRHFGLAPVSADGNPAPPCAEIVTPAEALASYNPLVETELLKADPEAFEQLRNEYVLRSEIVHTPQRL